MRYAALVVIILTLPLLISFIGRDIRRRDWAVLLLGALSFCTGQIDPSAALIVWPMWQGLSKGMFLSLLDTLALALIFTRTNRFSGVHFWPLIAVFAVPVLVSWTQAPAKTAAFFVIFQLIQMIIFFVALAGELQRPSAIRSLFNGLAIGLMIQAGYVLWQKAGGAIQASGTMPHQNILGIVVELSALPLLAAVLEGEKSKVVYAGLLAALIIIGGGGSRGAMLYFAIGAAILLVLSIARRNTPRKWQIVGMGILALAVAVPFALNTLNARFKGASVITEETARIAFERAAKEMASNHWLGVGANNFVSINNLEGYAARSGLDWAPALRSKPAHNAYLVARAETGWAGEIALMLLLGGIVWAGLVTGFRMKNLPILGVALGCSSAIFAAALHSSYEYAILTAQTQRFLFIDAALVSGCMLLMHRTAANRRRVLREGDLAEGEKPQDAPGLAAIIGRVGSA